MWSSFEKPADLEQQQANLLANAKDELKTLAPILPDGVSIAPHTTFSLSGNGKPVKPIVLWYVKSPDSVDGYVTLAAAVAKAQSL